MTKKLKDKIVIGNKEFTNDDVIIEPLPDGKIKVKTKGDPNKMLQKLQKHTSTKWKKKDVDDAVAACEQYIGRNLFNFKRVDIE